MVCLTEYPPHCCMQKPGGQGRANQQANLLAAGADILRGARLLPAQAHTMAAEAGPGHQLPAGGRTGQQVVQRHHGGHQHGRTTTQG